MELAKTRPNLKPQLWALLFAGATVLAFISTAQSAASLSYEGAAVPWIGLLKARLVDWYGCALFIPILYRLALARPIARSNWNATLPLHFGASLACAFGKEILYVAVGNWFRPGVFHLPEILAGDYFDEVLFFWAVIGLIHLHLRARPAITPPTTREPGVDSFTVRTRRGYRTVRAEEIEWIDAQGNYACLHTADGAHLVRETIKALDRGLDPRFVRVHRGAIVDSDKIERIEALSHGAYRLILASGAVIVSGRSYNHAVRRLLD